MASHLASSTQIDPTAVVSEKAKLGEGVVVGPHAVIEDWVEIGEECSIGPHAVLHSFVRLGKRNRIHPHAVLGGPPQDVSFGGRESWLEIGDDNLIRESVTMHRATSPDIPTRVGSGCFLMVNAHVAHDCRIGDGVILTNDVNLAGHVEIGDRAIVSGGVQVHQFARIGCLAMVGGLAGVSKDVLPFSLVSDNPARHYRLNTVGLRRAGITGTRYRVLQQAFRRLRQGEDLDGLPETPEIEHLREWLARPSRRGLTAFVQRNETAADRAPRG
jgi:UDP-N-acetylglucosamine acyltransferase